MDLGVHLPLIQFGDDELSRERLEAAVHSARECGFAALSSNDHFVFQRPWLDGPAALASVIERSGTMTLATTVALSSLRGPVALSKTLAAIDLLSGGRVVAALGPGSSPRDYEVAGVEFEERWKRFEESVVVLRALLEGEPPPQDARYYPLPADTVLSPGPARRIPVWVGSWGSPAGLRRVVRVADGWLASAYNTTPEVFAAARDGLPERFPNALATMWTWVTDDRGERDRVLNAVLAAMLKRDPAELQGQLCVGAPEECARLLSRYAEAGCERVYLWPLGDEPRQLERVAGEVAPLIASG